MKKLTRDAKFLLATNQKEALRSAGYSASALISAGYSLSDLISAGYSASALISAGYSLSDLRSAGYSASALRSAGYSASALISAGYSLSDLISAGYSASALRSAGYSASALRSAGYSASALRSAGYSASDLRSAGYSASALRSAGYSEEDFKEWDSIPKLEKPYTKLLNDIKTHQRIHQQSTFGPEECPSNICGTPMCTAGHLVNMAGEIGYKLKRKYGWRDAAAMIHYKAHPNMPCQDFGSIPQDWALAYIETMAEREKDPKKPIPSLPKKNIEVKKTTKKSSKKAAKKKKK